MFNPQIDSQELVNPYIHGHASGFLFGELEAEIEMAADISQLTDSVISMRFQQGHFSRNLIASSGNAFRRPNHENLTRLAGQVVHIITEGPNSKRVLHESIAHDQHMVSGYELALVGAHYTAGLEYFVRRGRMSRSNMHNNHLDELVAERVAYWFADKTYAVPENRHIHAAKLLCADLINTQIPELAHQAHYQQRGRMFAMRLASAYYWQDFINETTERQGVLSPEELRQTNDDYFAHIGANRTYTVKDCLADRNPNLAPQFGPQWLIEEPHVNLSGVEDTTARRIYPPLLNRALAFFTSNGGMAASSDVNFADRSGYTVDSPEFSRAYTMELAYETPPVALMGHNFYLGSDGDIYTMTGDLVAGIYGNWGGDGSAYEELRSELLLIYDDLVTPEIAAFQQPLNRVDILENSTDRQEKLYDLILKRVKFHNSDTRERLNQRHLVEHPVVGHTRDLPPTFRATPDARRLAWTEARIILPEFGQTYVRKHHRGDLPTVTHRGHKTKRR